MPKATHSLTPWLNERGAGLLLHPTSLHGDQGVGVLGTSAFELVDFLSDAGLRYWQMLPLGMTGYGDSPYQSFSAFAGNPYLIDLDPLMENGLLAWEDLGALRDLNQNQVDFAGLYRIKWPVLRLAYRNFRKQQRAYLPNYGMFDEFCEREAEWLEPFTGYMALKEQFSNKFWGDWPAEARTLDAAKKSKWWEVTADGRRAHAFFQYLFFGQWERLREYANEKGIEIIGDAPIFVALDSADVWASPELFEMKSPGKPAFVAGVPPDYFSAKGQLWGNPLYDWQRHIDTDFGWWRKRLEANFRLFDIVRLDHFRAFYDYWKIPAGSADATTGTWVDGPRHAFFQSVAKHLPESRLIAEDLGDLHDAVFEFRKEMNLPGMAILHFAFDGNGSNSYLPHNHQQQMAVYPGSHDNDTTRGWYDAASPDVQDQIRRYLRVSGDDISWDLVRACYGSVAKLAVVTMQDLMSLGEEGRMNVPGSEQGNWTWRMSRADFQQQRHCAAYLKELAWLYHR